MTDFAQMMDSPPPADWTDHGIFRGAFLAVFDAEDRAVLARGGRVLAVAAIAGDPERDPADHYRAAVQDARALAVYLAEVGELASEAESEHPAGAAVAKAAAHWRRQLEDVAAGMEADLRRLPAGRARPGG